MEEGFHFSYGAEMRLWFILELNGNQVGSIVAERGWNHPLSQNGRRDVIPVSLGKAYHIISVLHVSD